MTNAKATAVITPIATGDFEAMERLYVASVAANPAGFIQDLDYHGSIVTFTKKVLANGGAVSVAKVDNEVVGMVVLAPNEAPGEATLCKLHVYKDRHGAGLGRKLCEHVLGQASGLGFRKIVLDVVTSQTSAMALYKKLGFAEDKVEMWHGAFKGQPLAFEVMYMHRELTT